MTHDFEKALAALKALVYGGGNIGLDGKDDGGHRLLKGQIGFDDWSALKSALQAAIAAQNVAGDLGEVIERCENTKHLHGARGYYAPEDIDSLINAARLNAQSRQAVAEGYVSVPAIPTDEMTAAGIAYGLHTSVGSSWSEFVNGYYRAMLSAVPDAGEVG